MLENQNTDPTQEDAPDASPAPVEDNDVLREELKKATERADELESNMAKLRSMNDRRFNEQRDELLKLRAVKDREEDRQKSADQEAFEQRWSEEVNENPAKALEYYREMAREQQRSLTDQFDKRLEALKIDLLQPMSARLQDMDPSYVANRSEVDAFVDKHGVTREQALSIVMSLNEKADVAGPGATPNPGTVPTSGSQPPSEPEKESVRLPPDAASFLGMASLPPESQKRILEGAS